MAQSPVFEHINEIARRKLFMNLEPNDPPNRVDYYEFAAWQLREALFIAHEMGRTGKSLEEVADIYVAITAP